jgi:hypothetical protein
LSLVLRVKLCKAATKYVSNIIEDEANKDNEQEFNANQFEDEMSERKSDSDSSSCAGSG